MRPGPFQGGFEPAGVRHADAVDVVMGRNDDLGPQLLHHHVGPFRRQDVSVVADRQERDVDVADHLPDVSGRVLAVVAPVQKAQPAGLDDVHGVVPLRGFVGRAGVLAGRGDHRAAEWIFPLRFAHVFFGNAQDGDVAQDEAAGHAVQNHGRVDALGRVVVEVRVGDERDVRPLLGQVHLIPHAVLMRRIVAPRVDEHVDAARRGQLERHVAVIRDGDFPGALADPSVLLHRHDPIVVRVLFMRHAVRARGPRGEQHRGEQDGAPATESRRGCHLPLLGFARLSLWFPVRRFKNRGGQGRYSRCRSHWR